METNEIILRVISDFNKDNNNQVNLASVGAQTQLAKRICEALNNHDDTDVSSRTVNEQNTYYYKIVHEDV